MSVRVRNISGQTSAVKMLVLQRNPLIVRDRIVGEALHLCEARVRRGSRYIIKRSVSVGAVERCADILIQVIVGDEQVVTMIAGIGKNQGVGWSDLLLQLQTEFRIPRAAEGMRRSYVIRR